MDVLEARCLEALPVHGTDRHRRVTDGVPPLYVFVPIITVTVFGRLMRRATPV